MGDSNAASPTGQSSPEPQADAPALMDSAGQALFRLGRMFSKRPLQQVLTERSGRAIELSRVLVVQAVEAGPPETEPEVTVGVVAERLDIDPSTASRLVAETIRAGYLARGDASADGRRVPLVLTDVGRELAANARRYQRAVFEQVTRDWSERERQEFARLFIQFADSVTEARARLTNPHTPPQP